MSDILKVLKHVGQLARYAQVLPALLRLLDEVCSSLADRELSRAEIVELGQRVVDLLRLLPGKR